jgi:predicted Zn finger-like uncharacterized protein
MMQTRCPACQTSYRVTADQLKAAQGQVRCGHCNQIFDGLEHLLELAPAPPIPPIPPIPSRAPDVSSAPGAPSAPSIAPHTEAFDFDLGPATRPAAVPEGADGADDEVAGEDAAAHATDGPAPSHEDSAPPSPPQPDQGMRAADTSIPAASATPETPAADWSRFDETVPQSGSAWGWSSAALLALTLLLLQALVHFRVELAVIEPQLKPLLLSLCQPLDCDVPLPRKPEQLSIETSGLNPDPRHAGQLILSAVIKNRAPFTQSYPHLELTLTDTIDQPLLRKIIAPTDYLASGNATLAGLAAGGENALYLSLIPQPGERPAAGYRLYLFYP